MTCTQPGSFSDLELLEYSFVQLEQDTDLHAHLMECTDCRKRVTSMQRSVTALTQKLERLDCPNGTTLDEYIHHELPEPQQLEVMSHLTMCVHCRQDVALSTQFHQQYDRLLEWAEKPVVDRVVTHIRRFIATLRPDTGTLALRGSEAPALLNSATTPQAAHIHIYTYDDISVALWTYTQGIFRLEGIITSKAITSLPATITVKLVGQDNDTLLTNDLHDGWFTFTVTYPGIYSLEIRLTDIIIAIESIEF